MLRTRITIPDIKLNMIHYNIAITMGVYFSMSDFK